MWIGTYILDMWLLVTCAFIVSFASTLPSLVTTTPSSHSSVALMYTKQKDL